MNKLMDPEEGPVSNVTGGQSIAAGGCDGMYIGDVPPTTPYIAPYISPYPWAPPYRGVPAPNTTPKESLVADDGNEPDLIEVLTIWVREPSDPDGIVWLLNAFDADTVENTTSAWEEKLQEAYKTYGGENVRVVKTTMNYDKIVASFKPTEA